MGAVRAPAPARRTPRGSRLAAEPAFTL